MEENEDAREDAEGSEARAVIKLALLPALSS
jgi:hypothetical protein